MYLSVAIVYVEMIIKAFHSTGSEKARLVYFIFATMIGFFGYSTFAFLMYRVNVVWAQIPHDFFIIAYCIIFAYAIVRHQLMDIEIIIKKTLVFAGLLTSVFTILVLPTLLIQEYILRSASFGGKMIGLAISGIVIILTMKRIEAFLINITDKYLFQKKYDYKELLKTFTSEVLTVLELDKLMDLTVTKLTDIVKLSSCAVLLFDDEKQEFQVMASSNVKDPSVRLVRPDGIVTFMDETHGYVLLKELNDKKILIPGSIQEIVDKLNAELIIPMVVHDEVIGILSLGKKKSDEEYTQDDLDILLPLARTLAIAISNAQLFDELSKTQADAAQKDKMAVIGTLSAGINHEICNPLGIARGQCEAFLLNIKDGLYTHKTTEELLTKAKEIMGKVIHETDRATAITKKLSGFAKPAKGESEIVNIDKEIDDVLGLVGYELKLEKIEIEKKIGKDIPNIFVDRKQFQEVLFNLIRNAGQAIGEKGKIAITAKEDSGKIFIDIKDSGSGIPEDKIKQLFNPFFTTKDPGKGTGLGLFIVRQVVEKNGGRIYLKETKVGEGTTFTIEFPIASTEEAKVKK
jgi:signal transduction histidine kinase